MKPKVKYLTNKNGNKTDVVIPIKDWIAFERELEKLSKSKKQLIRKKKKNVHALEDESIRNFSSQAVSFAFWENSKEDLYQDYLKK